MGCCLSIRFGRTTESTEADRGMLGRPCARDKTSRKEDLPLRSASKSRLTIRVHHQPNTYFKKVTVILHSRRIRVWEWEGEGGDKTSPIARRGRTHNFVRVRLSCEIRPLVA